MLLSEINIYPVKSLRGMPLYSALVENRGLRFDRRWMLVNESGVFITQRECPNMATIAVEVSQGGLFFAAPGFGKLSVTHHPDDVETSRAQVWGSSLKVVVYDDETNGWLSAALGIKCRLVVMTESSQRRVNPFYAVRKFDDEVSFADGYPFLLIGQASLDNLNSRLEQPVPMNRFRPNFVVSGTEPFAEDKWKLIRIGDTEFHVVKPCARCVITTIDQANGVKNAKEPLKTLSTYRTQKGKVMFGQNLIAETAGTTISVGDAVRAIETK
ncbi:MAG: MOSC domain-containing protein [Acidobacteria bacterium]|nr:MOSC domain-containing protein [Acidobacteriota bacterium]MCA1608182.1 MOSC domain-containing protein [Acidobacteriota bacterium]